MSGRHQNTTWRALDAARQQALAATRSDLGELTKRLAETPIDPDGDPAHCENVWRREPPEIVRPYLLARFLRSDPCRWAPLLAAAIQESPAEFADETFRELSTRFEISSVPDAYGVLLYVSPAYAARFGFVPPDLRGAGALRDAFGGEPDPNEPDVRLALRDALLSADQARAIAAGIVVPTALPEFGGKVPHLVESFEVEPAHLIVLIRDVARFFSRAAEAGLSVQILWHGNP